MAAGSGSGAQSFSSTLTDLMTSLAVIFILLLVVFLKQAHDQSRSTKEQVTSQLSKLLEEKNLNLKQDPEDPLKLAVRVGEDILRFPLNGFQLSSPGREFVAGFFKKFAQQLCSPELQGKLDAVIIEGHTDRSGERTREGVKHNIELSQKRSFSVMEQALESIQSEPALYECLLKLSSASGRGSRSPVFEGQIYNADKSRRVEIKIRVKSAEQALKDAIVPRAK